MSGDRWIVAVLLGVSTACSEPAAPEAGRAHDVPGLDLAAASVNQSVTGGGQSILEFARWLETADGAILEAIERYNEEDFH